MQDTGILYNDFIITIRRLYLLYLQVIESQQQEYHSNNKIANKVTDITADQVLILYYFADDFTDNEHLIDKGLDIEQAQKDIDSLLEAKYLEKTEGKIMLSDKGNKIKKYYDQKFDIESKNLMYKGMMPKELSHILALLLRFESYWLSMLKKDQQSDEY